MTARRDGVCGAVSRHPEGGSDCLCLLDVHDVDRVHRCSTRGCSREWAGPEFARHSSAEIENEFGGDAA